ncbi:MAG: hypothetical protein K6C12_04545 [Oscillospiraceae bacterium]|nr:hypothetical protein [Oscillospiraceae bacterium]
MKNATPAKKIVSLFFAVLILLSLATPAFAAYGPSEDDLKDIGSKIEYPKAREYLSEYVYGVVKAPKGHSVFGYGSADRAGTKYEVLDGEDVVILAKRKNMSCCIVLWESAARWINSDYLVIYGEEEVRPDGPSAMDLKDINSHIEYPREKEYLSDYVYATVKAPKGHSVFGYGSADRAGHSFTVLDGEEVVIIARRGGMSCCIVRSDQVGRWINSDYLK